jgi:hypothetical protein
MVTARKPRKPAWQRIRDEATARADVAEAQRDALRTSLRDVLATLPNEWAPAEVQAVRRRARAVVEETGKPQESKS